jgi:hypothetical protein
MDYERYAPKRPGRTESAFEVAGFEERRCR